MVSIFKIFCENPLQQRVSEISMHDAQWQKWPLKKCNYPQIQAKTQRIHPKKHLGTAVRNETGIAEFNRRVTFTWRLFFVNHAI